MYHITKHWFILNYRFQGTDITPTGLEHTFVPTIEDALREALRIIRDSAKRIDISARNARIIARYKAGETLQELANLYDISFQRIHQIIQE